ncbi:MAG: hypothetical protein GVY18_13290 [Bacteroidetes bacterium]|nr:hypothetical protein [Bacteroidota bacterium]
MDSDRYRRSAFEVDNFIVLRDGGVFRRPGFEFCAQFDAFQDADAAVLRVINFECQFDEDVAIVLGRQRMWAFDDGELSWFTEAGESPYTDGDIWDVGYTQDGDTLYLTHPDYAPRRLTRVSREPSQFTLDILPLDAIPQHNFNDASSPTSEGTVLSFDFANTWAEGDTYELAIDTINFNVDPAPQTYSTDPAVMRSRLKSHIAAIINLSATSIFGGETVSVTVTGDGPFIVQISPVSYSDQIAISVDSVTTAGDGTLSISPASGDALNAPEDAWSNTRGWPAFCTLHERRLVFAGHPVLRNRVWGSAVADYSDWELGPFDDDAFEFDLVGSGRVDIRWIASRQYLVVGTQSGEFVQLNRPLTPSSPYFAKQTQYRSANVRPLAVNAATMYCTVNGRKLRQLQYSDDVDGFQSADLTYIDSDVMSEGIVDMAYGQEPDSIIWCVTRSGMLMGLTYDPDVGVVAWHRHYTLGKIKSVCVTHEGGRDNVYVIAARDGIWCLLRMKYSSDYFTVERPSTEALGVETYPLAEKDEFLDYYRVANTVVRSDGVAVPVSGGALGGYEVEVMFDGARAKQEVLDGTEVVVPGNTAPARCVVGLPYKSLLVPTPIEGADQGTSQTNLTRFAQIYLRLVESAMPTIDGVRPEERFPSDKMGEEPPLFTGDVRLSGVDATRPHTMRIEADMPYPCYIAGMFGVVESNED